MQNESEAGTAHPQPFGPEHAAAYDTRFQRLAPLRAPIDYLCRAVLQEVPEGGRILCVGAGTGAELLALAEALPTARFTAVEPAPAMLAVCRQRTAAAGIAARCTFHEGYLGSLDEEQTDFDGATSILVSQFILDEDERRDFFAQIARRLKPSAPLVTADLARASSEAVHQQLFALWMELMLEAEMDDQERQRYRDNFGKGFSLLEVDLLAELIASAGFETPALCCQALHIHTWLARRKELP